MNKFKVLSILTSLLFLYLFVVLLFDTASFFVDLGIDAGEAAFFIARRASVFMLGMSILLFWGKNLPHSESRQMIIIFAAIIMSGLAMMGTYEYARGYLGAAIFQAISIESIVAVSYLILFFSNRKSSRIDV